MSISIDQTQFNQAKKANISADFGKLDVNNDGKIDKEDAILAETSDIRKQIVSMIDEDSAIEETGATKEAKDGEAVSGEEQVAKTEEEMLAAAKEKIDNMDGVKGVGENSSLQEVNRAVEVLTGHIAQLDGEIAKIDAELAKIQEVYNSKMAEKDTYEVEYNNHASRLESETGNLNLALKGAENKAEAQGIIQTENVKKAVEAANKKFNSQEGAKGQPLKAFIEQELANVPGMAPINMGHIGRITTALAEIGADMNIAGQKLESTLSDLNTISGQMDGLKALRSEKQIERDYAQTKLDGLTAIQTKKQAEEDAKNASQNDGGSGGSGGGDPIGFLDKEGNRFDFVVDRNNDSKFNGPNEFLGWENQWAEMEALDSDKNGVVEGKELNGVQMLQTGKDGSQKFINASDMNVKINLKSYKKAEEGASVGKGQDLLGSFKVTASGKDNLTGYNTFDSADYLNKEYGNMFNKSFGNETTSAGGKSAEQTYAKVDIEEILNQSKASIQATSSYVEAVEKNGKSELTLASDVDKEYKPEEKYTQKASAENKDNSKKEEKEEAYNPFAKKLAKAA